MTTPVLTKDGKRLAEVLVMVGILKTGNGWMHPTDDWYTFDVPPALNTAAASLRLPLKGDASLRWALAAWRCRECRCHTFAEVAEQKVDGSFGPGPLVRCVNCKGTFPTPLARPQPEAKGPVAAGVLIDGLTLEQLIHNYGAAEYNAAVDASEGADPEHYEPKIAEAKAKLMQGIAALASTTPPAEAKTPDAGVGLREAAQALLDASIADYGLSDDDTDPEPVAMGFRGGTAVTFGHLRRLKAALTPTGLAGEDDTGVREARGSLTFSSKYHRDEIARRVPNDDDGETLARVQSDASLLHAALGTGSANGFLPETVAGVRAACAALAPQPPKAETPAGVGAERRYYPQRGRTGGWYSYDSHRDDTVSWFPTKEQAEYDCASLNSTLSTAPAARPGDEVERVRHVKRGTEYEVLGEALERLSRAARMWFDDRSPDASELGMALIAAEEALASASTADGGAIR